MKKSFKMMVVAAMLFSATLSANAQFSKKDNNREPDRFHMGLRAGLTVNTLMGDVNDRASSLLAPTAGLALDFQVAPIPIFVGLGLNYVNQGAMMETRYEDEVYNTHAIQMPVTASYHLNVAPNLFINPFVGFVMSYAADSDFDDVNEFNAGFRVGCGLNFGRLTFDLGYDLGLVNIIDSDRSSVNTGTFFMTVGFNWAGSR